MTALGKLCLILAVSTSVQAQSWNRPLFEDWQREDNLLSFAYNAIKWQQTKLNDVDNAFHSQAVYHALNHAENGEEVEWFSDRSRDKGKVRIVYTWIASGSTCRRMQHYIYTDRAQRSWAETACMNANDGRWVFTDK